MKTYPYWWEFYKPYHFQNTQVSNSSYDLVVVGAGYTGVSAAIQASSKGLKTLLIDQLALGEGASTRSAGMVSGGLNLGKKINLFRDYGEDLAKKFIQESIGSYEYLEDQINHHLEEVSYQKTGRLVLAHSKKKLDALWIDSAEEIIVQSAWQLLKPNGILIYPKAGSHFIAADSTNLAMDWTCSKKPTN